MRVQLATVRGLKKRKIEENTQKNITFELFELEKN